MILTPLTFAWIGLVAFLGFLSVVLNITVQI